MCPFLTGFEELSNVKKTNNKYFTQFIVKFTLSLGVCVFAMLMKAWIFETTHLKWIAFPYISVYTLFLGNGL